MTKETVQKFLDEINTKVWTNDCSMQEYCRKKCSDVFESKLGYLVEFEKPSIKKDFCFGHGYCGITTEEETQKAFDNALNAKTNENYFIRENLEWYERYLELLNDTKYWDLHLVVRNKNTKICSLKSEKYFCHYEWERKNIVETLSTDDIEKIREIIELEKEKFLKRLNTYLKKYGLSKVHSWTYLVD